MEMEIASYQVGAGDYRKFDVSPVDAEGMGYPPIADFDDHEDALAFCAMKNSQIQQLTPEGQWTPAMLAVWGVAMSFLHNEPEPEFAELTLGEYQYEIARRMVEAAKS